MSKLGDLGENLAIEILSRPQNGFVKVRNLNTDYPNHPYVDLYTERNGERYVISVKTRRKYGADGALNASYNLLEKRTGVIEEELAQVKALAHEYNATAAWVVIAGEASVFSVYFGIFEDILRSGRYSIPMKPADLPGYECMAENEPHYYPEFAREGTDAAVKSDKDMFSAAYPNITTWVRNGGWMEIGRDYNVQSFIRALDEGGMIWEGEHQYSTMDAAFKALDAGIIAFLNEQGIKL